MVFLITIGGLTASAYATTTHKQTKYADFTKDFTVKDRGGDVLFEYRAGYNGTFDPIPRSSFARAWTEEKIGKNCYGYVATTLYAVNNENVHKYWSGKSDGGWYWCKDAEIDWQFYAKRVTYYADHRSYDSNDIRQVYEFEAK